MKESHGFALPVNMHNNLKTKSVKQFSSILNAVYYFTHFQFKKKCRYLNYESATGRHQEINQNHNQYES